MAGWDKNHPIFFKVYILTVPLAEPYDRSKSNNNTSRDRSRQ